MRSWMRWTLAGTLAVAALAVAAIGGALVLLDRHMDHDGVLVEGEVLAVNELWGTFEASYEAGDLEVVAEITYWESAPLVGELVAIEYDPDDPVYARTAGSNEDLYAGAGFLLASAVAFAGALGATAWAVLAPRRARRRAAADVWPPPGSDTWGPWTGSPYAGQQAPPPSVAPPPSASPYAPPK